MLGQTIHHHMYTILRVSPTFLSVAEEIALAAMARVSTRNIFHFGGMVPIYVCVNVLCLGTNGA